MMMRKQVIGVVSIMMLLPGVLAPAAQDNTRMLNAVKSWVGETGNQVIALGSWVSGGAYKPGSSDHDLRLVMPAGTSPAEAARRWKAARLGLENAIRREFGAERARDILAKTNLYAPSQLMAGVGSSRDAARVYTRVNQVPNMAFTAPVTDQVHSKYIEGLYGDGAKAFTQYYEGVKGRFIYRSGENVYSGVTDLTHMEEGWAKFTVSGTANTARQWGEHALEELANRDLRAVGKHLERVEKDLAKSRELAGLGTGTALRDELRQLRGKIAAASSGELEALSREIRSVVARSQSEARLLAGIGRSGPLQRGMYRIVLDAFEARSALGTLLRKGYDSVSRQVTFENFIRGLVLYSAATSISEAYAKSWLETAKQAASFYYLLPAGLMAQITDAILEEAKASGFIFAAGSQEAWNLMAGIYTALGRRRTDPDPRRSYTLDDLVQNIHSEAKLKSLVYSQAKRAADLKLGSDNQQIDSAVAEAIYRRCMPVILQAWRMKRDELLGEYASLAELAQHAPLLVTYTPAPASVERGPATVSAGVRGQSDGLGKGLERMNAIIKLLCGKGAWVNSEYEWQPAGQGDDLVTVTRSFTFAKPGVYPVKVHLKVRPHAQGIEPGSILLKPCDSWGGVDIEVVDKAPEAKKAKPPAVVKKPKPVPEPVKEVGGYWKFTGERIVRGKPFLVGPADTTKVDAAGGGGAITAVCSTKNWRSVAAFSWTASKGLDVLKPDDRITFSGTLTHSGEGSADAGITIQPYGQPPGTGHISGMVIMHGFSGTTRRTTERPGGLTVPEGSRYSHKPIELRFEVYPGCAASALYRTYEWSAGAAPRDAGKPASAAGWAGAWSSNFGRIRLQQNGSRVTGAYDYKGGRLEGTVAGNVLQGRWTQTNGSGLFEFRMGADGRSFSGRWGNGETLSGGDWNGRRE